MEVVEIILLAVLLLAALFIIVAVIFQKSGDEGLSSTIAGGNESYLSKENAPSSEKVWFKWTLIVALIFAVAVLILFSPTTPLILRPTIGVTIISLSTVISSESNNDKLMRVSWDALFFMDVILGDRLWPVIICIGNRQNKRGSSRCSG